MSSTSSIRTLLRSHFPSYAAVAVMGIFVNILMLTGAVFMLQIYDRVLPANSVEALLTLFILVVVFYAAYGLLDLARSRVLSRTALQMHERLRRQLFGLVMDRAVISGGSSMAAEPLRELNIFTSFLAGPGLPALFDAPMMVLYISIIYLLHPLLALLAVGAALILFALAVINDLITRHAQEAAIVATNRANTLVQSLIRAVEPARAMGMIRNLRERWLALDDEAQAKQDKSAGRMAGMGSLSRALRMLLQSAMLGLGAWLVIRGEITPGVMVVASIILGRALQPVETAIVHWRSYQRYRVAKQRLDEILRHPPTLRDDDNRPAPEATPKGDLKLVGVHAVPPGGRRAVLQNIRFHIAPGQFLLVIGPNGSGKSVLARICAAIWKPVRGKVLLDNADYAIWPPEQLGRLIGYLPQNVQLLEGTIGENIARFSAPDEKALHEAVHAACVADDIKAMGGFDREVGTEGASLSLGERKRVALARALYGNPVLLVLDEPLAGLDEAGRQTFIRAMSGMKDRGQTVVLVEHVPVLSEKGREPLAWEKAVLDLADAILVLRNGQQVNFRTRQEGGGSP